MVISLKVAMVTSHITEKAVLLIDVLTCVFLYVAL
jgi:hypothetical protein